MFTVNEKHSSANAPGDAHIARFYENEDALIHSVQNFLRDADICVVIATKDHKNKIEKNFRMRDLNLREAIIKRKYYAYDTDEIRSLLMTNGVPDKKLFSIFFGNLLSPYYGTSNKIKIYGEMVSVLRAEGKHAEAFAVEKFWNYLQKKYNFSMYCTYPITDLTNKEDSNFFKQIENTHTHVIPNDNFESFIGKIDIYKEMVRLQQKEMAFNKESKNINNLERLKEDFLNITSHELNTPLTTLKIFINLLHKQIVKDDDMKYLPFVKKIEDQANKLIDLTSNLIDVSRIGSGKFVLDKKLFNLTKCIEDLISQIQHATDKNKIVFKSKTAVDVYGDKEKISQVIANLITNAIKFSPDGKNINIKLEKKKDHLLISIRDYGHGIKKRERKRIFDRFYRVLDREGNTFPGLGLGLYLASEIIKSHGGKIWVDSKTNKGSVFKFTLPFSSY